jgi:hypothetical protein
MIHYFRRFFFPAELLLKYSLQLPACNSDRTAEFIVMNWQFDENMLRDFSFNLNRNILKASLLNANFHFRLISRLIR